MVQPELHVNPRNLLEAVDIKTTKGRERQRSEDNRQQSFGIRKTLSWGGMPKTTKQMVTTHVEYLMLQHCAKVTAQ